MMDVLALADAEEEVTGFLPLDRLNEATDLIMSNATSAKAIAAHIWYKLRMEDRDDPTLGELMTMTCNVLFTPKLRAFLYLEKR